MLLDDPREFEQVLLQCSHVPGQCSHILCQRGSARGKLGLVLRQKLRVALNPFKSARTATLVTSAPKFWNLVDES